MPLQPCRIFLKKHLASRSQIQSLQYPKLSKLVSSLHRISHKVSISSPLGRDDLSVFCNFSFLNTHIESIYPWHSQGKKSIHLCQVLHTGISITSCTSPPCLSEKHSCICSPAAKMRHLLNRYPDLAHVLF